MKKNVVIRGALLLIIAAFTMPLFVSAQDSKAQKLIADSRNAKAQFIKSDGMMQSLLITHMPM